VVRVKVSAAAGAARAKRRTVATVGEESFIEESGEQ
jgi:hypothetical protein